MGKYILLIFTTLTLNLYSQTYLISRNSISLNNDQLINKFGTNLKYKYQEAPTYTLLYSNGSLTFILSEGTVSEIIYLFKYKSDFLEFITNNSVYWIRTGNGSWVDIKDNSIVINRDIAENAQDFIIVTKNKNCIHK